MTPRLNDGRIELLDQLWASDLVWHGGSLGECEATTFGTRYRNGKSCQDDHFGYG